MMVLKNPLLLLVCCLLFTFTALTQSTRKIFDEVSASSLKPLGRYQLTENNELELISSGVHVGVGFEGKSCELFVSVAAAGMHNYLQYELDGVYHRKIRVAGQQSSAITITAHGYGNHKLVIFKATEAHSGGILVQKIRGKNVRALRPSTAPLIEFIGNSITCGAAADPATIPCGAGVYHDQHNAYYSYGARVARALGADFIISGVSGIGIYRTWNSEGPAMPAVYEKLSFQETEQKTWDFGLFTPAIVSIALGTNDFSRGDGTKSRLPFDSLVFIKEYTGFLRLVKAKYPAAQIVLLSSPMISGEQAMVFQNCLESIKSSIDRLYPEGKKIALHFSRPMQPHGCSGHPNLADHAIMAKELIPFFKQFL